MSGFPPGARNIALCPAKGYEIHGYWRKESPANDLAAYSRVSPAVLASKLLAQR
jgi:hypothetical protein